MRKTRFRLLRTALAAFAAIAAIGATSVVALAYPPAKHNQLSVKCQPGNVDGNFGNCSVVATDKDKNDNPRAGQTISFALTSGPGSVQPSSSFTDSKGRASSSYQVGSDVCTMTSPPTSATITATESGPGSDEQVTAQTTVKIQCPKPKPTPKPKPAGPNGPQGNGPANNGPNGPQGNNDAASLAIDGHSNTLSGTMLAVGLLAFVLTVSVAITGRLRLRRFRR